MFLVFVIRASRDQSRAFDLPEARSRLRDRLYKRENSAMAFALFFLGEYANMVLMSGMTVISVPGRLVPPFESQS